MKGCLWLHSTTIKQKQALTVSNLSKVILNLANSKEHNDFLFQALLLTGFFALMHLGELTFHNDISLRNWKKVTKRSTVIVSADQHEFHLPSHKADPFFEGNHIIKRQYCNINPLAAFTTYLHSHDQKLPLSSPLWLTSSGSIPTHQFFISRLRHYFKHNITGQSMRAGGATSLVKNGVPPSLIQLIGHWSSDAFFIYICKSPVLILNSLLSLSHNLSYFSNLNSYIKNNNNNNPLTFKSFY